MPEKTGKAMRMTLSCIICAHNEERYIAACLKSLRLADHPEWEAIVVNDASTDTTSEIIDFFAKKHANLRRYDIAPNIGLGSARNFALLLAQGEYLAFVDADDYIDAAALAAKVDAMTDAETDILISGHSRLHDAGLTAVPIEPGAFPGRIAACFYLMRAFGTWGSCMHIYRRDHVLRNRCFFAQGFYYEDVVFCLRALHTARTAVADPAPFYVSRRNNEGITRGKVATPLHLISSARLYYDIVTFLRTMPESDLLREAFAQACDILLREHLPRMIMPVRQGAHTASAEFFKTFMYYMQCRDTPFSRAVLRIIQKNMPGGTP